MSGFSRAYLMLVGAVLLVIVALLASDANVQSVVHPSNSVYTTIEYAIATIVLGLASFAFVLAFLPSFLHWYSTKALFVAVTASVILTAVLIGAYHWFGLTLV
jgi:hypothetical protein